MASPHRNRIQVACFICGVPFETIPSRIKMWPNICCSKKCGGIKQSRERCGENNPAWRGGRNIDPRTGYVYVLVGRKKYRLEHRVVMEKALGRALPSDVHVHHKNETKGDNRLNNLEPLSNKKHMSKHTLKSWGKRGVSRCIICERSDRPHYGRGKCTYCWAQARPKRIDPRRNRVGPSWGKHSCPTCCVACGKSDKQPRAGGLCSRCYNKIANAKRRNH